MSTKKKNTKKAVEVAEVTPAVEVAQAVTSTEIVTETKKLGRPVNPESVRQKKLADRQALIEAGKVFKRGRPVDENSPRQLRLKAMQERAAANGGVIKRGRPAAKKEEATATVAVEEVKEA